ncbi:MAG: gliding motility-associated C-terminal domain-containing protein [Sphingobacteriia bacterium]|nr:MAG: gliding motility-associated C-terminal domain-containing protein [Sphingobacteriia bacterium]
MPLLKSTFLALILIVQLQSNAQLCTGSLGNPVVNITFGNGSTLAEALKKGVTNLVYVSSSCPIDTTYTITNLTTSCFGSAWHTVSEDHTKDFKGRYMLINARNTPDDFYIDTISGLCGNTTYEFGAWIANVLKPASCGGGGVKPDLTFSIETTNGNVLKTYNTQGIQESAQLTWKQYGFLFKPDINTTAIVLRIRNNAGIGCGNDLAIDDITFRPCGPAIVTQVQNNSVTLLNICMANQVPLQFSTTVGTGFLSPFFQWQSSIDTGKTWVNINGAGSTDYLRQPTGIGSFKYRMQVGESANLANSDCRVVSSEITLNLFPMPPSNATKNIVQCRGGLVEFTAAKGSDPLLQYTWKGPNNFSAAIQNPAFKSIHITDEGQYLVAIKTAAGCTTTDTINLKVFNAINGKLSGNSLICFGESTPLVASGSTHYTWVPATGLSATNTASVIAKPIDTTQYYVLIGDGTGCSDSISVTIKVVKPPLVNAGTDKRILAGNSINLLGSISGQYQSYRWTPSFAMINANSLTPTVTPSQTTSYELRAVGSASCGEVKDTVNIIVFIKTEPPNAFSPNGDGVNDLWVIPGLELYPNAALTVFNRAGMVVYQSKPYSSSWNGTFKGNALPVGTYYYIIERGMGFEVLSGSIQLIR